MLIFPEKAVIMVFAGGHSAFPGIYRKRLRFQRSRFLRFKSPRSGKNEAVLPPKRSRQDGKRRKDAAITQCVFLLKHGVPRHFCCAAWEP